MPGDRVISFLRFLRFQNVFMLDFFCANKNPELGIQYLEIVKIRFKAI